MVAKSQLSIPEELASLKQYSAACALDVVITTKANLSTAATDEVTILEVDFIFSLLRRFECAARNLSRRSQTKILCLLHYLLKEIQQWWRDLVGTPRLSQTFLLNYLPPRLLSACKKSSLRADVSELMVTHQVLKSRMTSFAARSALAKGFLSERLANAELREAPIMSRRARRAAGTCRRPEK
jgi:hypothetical protein